MQHTHPSLRRPTARDRLDLVLCAASLSGLALIAQLGTVGAALFIAPWALVVLTRPTAALESLIRNAALLVLPAMAVASTAWSQNPSLTFRHGAEYALTVLIAIWAASCIRPKDFLWALVFAVAAVLFVSAAFGAWEVEEYSGAYVLVGVFESKNQLALYAAIGVLASLGLLLASPASALSAIALCAMGVLGLMALVYSRSTGSIVFCLASIVLVLVLKFVTLLPRGARLVLLWTGALLGGAVAAAAFLFVDLETFLGSLGKDASLTGRTDLWDSALSLIDERPLLGVGFNAFWYIGNPEAERLWFISNVKPGAGFNFHNLYLNTAVELGVVGLIALLGFLLVTAVRVLIALAFYPRAHTYFAAAILIYFVLLSTLEAYFLYEFHLAAMLLVMCWCYARPHVPAAARERRALARLDGCPSGPGGTRTIESIVI